MHLVVCAVAHVFARVAHLWRLCPHPSPLSPTQRHYSKPQGLCAPNTLDRSHANRQLVNGTIAAPPAFIKLKGGECRIKLNCLQALESWLLDLPLALLSLLLAIDYVAPLEVTTSHISKGRCPHGIPAPAVHTTHGRGWLYIAFGKCRYKQLEWHFLLYADVWQLLVHASQNAHVHADAQLPNAVSHATKAVPGNLSNQFVLLHTERMACDGTWASAEARDTRAGAGTSSTTCNDGTQKRRWHLRETANHWQMLVHTEPQQTKTSNEWVNTNGWVNFDMQTTDGADT